MMRRIAISAMTLLGVWCTGASAAGLRDGLYQIDSESMLPTIRPEDRVKVVHDWTDVPKLKAGEVVVYRNPKANNELWLKRVVGLPGDKVQMILGKLSINGKPAGRKPLGGCTFSGADGQQISGSCYQETLPGASASTESILVTQTGFGQLDDTPEIVVPAGFVFVIGDNRRNSIDSRLPVEHGLVALADIEGRVVLSATPAGPLAARPSPVPAAKPAAPAKPAG